MALESDAFGKLKKLGRDYQEIKDKLRNNDDNIVDNLNSQERLDRISKVAAIIENPELAMELAIQKEQYFYNVCIHCSGSAELGKQGAQLRTHFLTSWQLRLDFSRKTTLKIHQKID